MPREMADADIGGAIVGMGYTTWKDGAMVHIKAGTRLTGDQVRAMPKANRRSFISNGTLQIFPTAEAVVGRARFMVQVKKDQYDVIEGRKLNDHPLSREEAEALVAQK